MSSVEPGRVTVWRSWGPSRCVSIGREDLREAGLYDDDAGRAYRELLDLVEQLEWVQA